MCGAAVPCATRAHAAAVIIEAGEMPCWYDRPAGAAVYAGVDSTVFAGGPEPPGARHPAVIDGISGFSVGGRGARQHPDGFAYEREA